MQTYELRGRIGAPTNMDVRLVFATWGTTCKLVKILTADGAEMNLDSALFALGTDQLGMTGEPDEIVRRARQSAERECSFRVAQLHKTSPKPVLH